tara:strand:+ start:830 stop:2095 length:1266 start_codon:yes stop_codon:yes gene_type:complete
MITVDDIKNKNFSLCVIGMGRIGLPLAISFAKNDVNVLGNEKNKDTLEKLNNHELPFFEKDMKSAFSYALENNNITFDDDNEKTIQTCDIIIIAVGTPLKENLLPDMSLITNVIEQVCGKAKNDSIIILRSTLAPGTTEKQILPKILEMNNTLNVAVCPERIVEGRAMEEIEKLPEIIGIKNSKIGNIVKELFLLLGNKEITITDTKTAETAKIFANVFRYVNFALANEFALICENLQVNAHEAIMLANKSYPRGGIPQPGPAGGPCLHKDGHFLANTSIFNLTKTSWLLNESIPSHIVTTIENHVGKIYGMQIGVLGRSYKADIDDMRDSLAMKLIEELKNKQAKVVSYEPNDKNSDSLNDVLKSEIVILAVNHSEFENITEDMFDKTKLVYDAWGVFRKLNFSTKGIKYIGLGKSLKDD